MVKRELIRKKRKVKLYYDRMTRKGKEFKRCEKVLVKDIKKESG